VQKVVEILSLNKTEKATSMLAKHVHYSIITTCTQSTFSRWS